MTTDGARPMDVDAGEPAVGALVPPGIPPEVPSPRPEVLARVLDGLRDLPARRTDADAAADPADAAADPAGSAAGSAGSAADPAGSAAYPAGSAADPAEVVAASVADARPPAAHGDVAPPLLPLPRRRP